MVNQTAAAGAVDIRTETGKMAAENQPHITTDDPPAASPVNTGPQHRLQDVLPDIMQLAQRVGGLKQLEEIVHDLQAGKQD